MEDSKQPFIDPFADDIVNEPRRVEYSVPGLNEDAVERVLADIEVLCESERPRIGLRSPKALLVLSPRAGFGKSHLIGTLFKRLSGRVTLVNARPFQDPDTCWKSVLMRIVQELSFPELYGEDSDEGSADHATQLELFAHGVLSQVVVNYLSANNGKPKTIEALNQPAERLTWLKDNQIWRDAMHGHLNEGQWLGGVQSRFNRRGFRPHASLETWLKVLYGYTYRDDWNIRQSCLDWIQCDPIDDEAAGAVGIRLADRVRVDQTATELDELAKSRVLDLCRLAGFFRPFLICFDQTESYGKSTELARALGTVVTDLVDEAETQLTLITANLDPWEKRLRDHWEEASRDRLARPYINLRGINREQGTALAERRMSLLDTPAERMTRFWGDRRWLDTFFGGTENISVRMFLHACSRRWVESDTAGVVEPEPVRQEPLPALFARYTDAISAKPRRLVYDRDVFYWLVSELAAGVEGVTVDKIKVRSRENQPRWRRGNREYIFGFESSNHWKRWHTIAQSAMKSEGMAAERVLVCLRTPELQRIPKPTWHVAKPEIEQAKRGRLLILELDAHQLVRLYAAQELYADALQGDIERDPEEIADFLRLELADFWRSILDWPENALSGSQFTSPDAPASGVLSRKVTEVVRRQKFLSLENLIAQLPDNPDRETVLGICGETGRIKVYPTSNMTVVQWRSSD